MNQLRSSKPWVKHPRKDSLSGATSSSASAIAPTDKRQRSKCKRRQPLTDSEEDDDAHNEDQVDENLVEEDLLEIQLHYDQHQNQDNPVSSGASGCMLVPQEEEDHAMEEELGNQADVSLAGAGAGAGAGADAGTATADDAEVTTESAPGHTNAHPPPQEGKDEATADAFQSPLAPNDDDGDGVPQQYRKRMRMEVASGAEKDIVATLIHLYDSTRPPLPAPQQSAAETSVPIAEVPAAVSSQGMPRISSFPPPLVPSSDAMPGNIPSSIAYNPTMPMVGQTPFQESAAAEGLPNGLQTPAMSRQTLDNFKNLVHHNQNDLLITRDWIHDHLGSLHQCMGLLGSQAESELTQCFRQVVECMAEQVKQSVMDRQRVLATPYWIQAINSVRDFATHCGCVL
jgi:hypothetical protein